MQAQRRWGGGVGRGKDGGRYFVFWGGVMFVWAGRVMMRDPVEFEHIRLLVPFPLIH